MKLFSTSGGIVAIAMITSLAACSGSSTGGANPGTGGNTTAGDYNARFEAVTSRAPTSDMPTRLEANYAGQFKVGFGQGQGKNLLGIDTDLDTATVMGDLDLAVDWTDGQTANPFTGRAHGITVGQEGSTERVALEGELTVDPSLPGTITRTVIPSQVINGQTIPEVQTGAMMVHMAGQVSHGERRGDVNLQLGGNFFGPQGEAIAGTAVGAIRDANNPTGAVADLGVGGSFYLEQQ